jgi:hypothetical protein
MLLQGYSADVNRGVYPPKAMEQTSPVKKPDDLFVSRVSGFSLLLSSLACFTLKQRSDTVRYRAVPHSRLPCGTARCRTVSCGKRICKFVQIWVLMYASIWWKWRLMTGIVVAAAAYYYLEDEHNMKMQVRRSAKTLLNSLRNKSYR